MAVKSRLSVILKVVITQACVAFAITAIIAGIYGVDRSMSTFIGGMIAFIPNAYFGVKMLLNLGSDPKKILNQFYSAELIKFLLTAVLFVVAIKIPTVDFKWLLLGYFAVISVFWFAVLIWRN